MKILIFCLATVAIISCDEITCSSTCKDYKTCSILNVGANTTSNITLTNSLVCDSGVDNGVGYLFQNMTACKLKYAAIELSLLVEEIQWDAMAVVESIFDDEEFWLPGCEWGHFGAAMCLYTSLPERGTTCKGDAALTKENMFCPGECMALGNSCFNFDKYRNLKASFTDFCNSHSANDTKTACFKGQVHQSGLTNPACSNSDVKATSLMGPYVLAAVALVLAAVALIGLALVTVRNGSAGSPNSF